MLFLHAAVVNQLIATAVSPCAACAYTLSAGVCACAGEKAMQQRVGYRHSFDRCFEWAPVSWRKPIVDSSWNLAKSTQQTFSHSSNHRQSGLHCETLSVANAWLLMGMCGNKQAEPDWSSQDGTSPWWYKLWNSLLKPHPGSCPFCLWPSTKDATGKKHSGVGGWVGLVAMCLPYMDYCPYSNFMACTKPMLYCIY